MAKNNFVNKQSMQLIKMYLLKKGVPPAKIDEIRSAFVNDAVRESDDILYDRIFTCIALSLRRAFGFGQQRIMKCLREFDSLSCTLIDRPELNWDDYMQELRDETGIVVRTDAENRFIVEYRGKDAEEG